MYVVPIPLEHFHVLDNCYVVHNRLYCFIECHRFFVKLNVPFVIRIHQFVKKKKTTTENMRRQKTRRYESEKKRELNRIDLCMSGQHGVEHQNRTK